MKKDYYLTTSEIRIFDNTLPGRCSHCLTQLSSTAKSGKATRRSAATFRCRPFLASSAGKSASGGSSDKLHFLLSAYGTADGMGG